jgi:predicted amidophosphoribosyltransferase
LASGEPGSAELAQILRSGPVRVTLDKLVKAAAEAIGVDYMVLGLRHHDQYEFISTHGVPLTGYSDRVPAQRMSARLFDREVEVPDLQKETNFVVLDVVSEARHWRYGVNVPVRLLRPLTDEGVLALSGASRQKLDIGGKALSQLRLFADIVADLVWLTVQIRSARTHAKTVEVVSNVLISSIKNSPFPIAIIDDNLCTVGFSPRFIEDQKARGAGSPTPGQCMSDAWLDDKAQAAIRKSIRSGKPVIAYPTTLPGTKTTLWFDFHRLAYNDVPSPFGIIGFHRPDESTDFIKGRSSSLAWAPNPSKVSDISSSYDDGVGPVSRFLLTTLPERPRLLKRGSQRYLGARTWRKALKDHQLAALKALKTASPDHFVATVAKEMVELIQSTFGDGRGGMVTSVPCGHSGPLCLCDRVGREVARIMNLPFVEAFEFQPVRGSSHPKNNVKRPKMVRSANPISGPVILVDDVATSGAHVEEAARMLKDAGPVWPVVWIAD